jgi:hypothetical protein
MIILAKVISLLEKSELTELLGTDFKMNRWVWLNRDMFADMVLNALDYNDADEAVIFDFIKEIKEAIIIDIIRKKMKSIGWLEVSQKIFHELENGFNITQDIDTYVFVEKKLYMTKILQKLQEMEWILKAMAIDYNQHLSDNNSLQKVYEELFKTNDMIIEELLLTGEYRINTCLWKYNRKLKAVFFYKNGKSHRQWAEGNANFTFYELSR